MKGTCPVEAVREFQEFECNSGTGRPFAWESTL